MTSVARDEDDVPVTMALLCFLHLMDKSRSAFIAESQIANDLDMPLPDDWHTRCRKLMFKQHGEACKKMGLALNEITFKTLLDAVSHAPDGIIEEMDATESKDLPSRFVFNPWKGGVRRA